MWLDFSLIRNRPKSGRMIYVDGGFESSFAVMNFLVVSKNYKCRRVQHAISLLLSSVQILMKRRTAAQMGFK